MPSPALLLLAATLLPLAAFALLLFAGKRIGNPLSGWLATLFIAASFICSIAAMVAWFQADPGHYQGSEWGKGYGPIDITFRFLPVGAGSQPNGISQDHPGYLDLGLYIDSLTIAMFAMITLVATLVHIFSVGYMRQDARYHRFFAFLSLFCFSMLGLTLGGTLLHIFIFWELVGLCSYLLIGFWYDAPAAANAALKAFLVNRVGDVGFLIGLGILFHYMGNATLPDLWTYLGSAGSGQAVQLPGGIEFKTAWLTVMGIGLFFGAVAKSAQFPLHVWLPDAMEGPTPVSALIHAATMVAAGVYLVARIYPILTPSAKLFIAIIGLITLTMGALIAMVQNDIKRLLAYSTISQLGYMMLALGIGSWVGGLFHLMTHAFFKSLLFLAAGSVIHAADHEQEMTQFGGLWRKIPMTAITFGIAVLTIAAAPSFSAAASKSMILADTGAFATLAQQEGRSTAYALFFIVPTAVAYLTAFYMARCWMLTFWGKPRNQELYDQARESPILWGPLCVLAFLSIVSGRYLNVEPLLESSIRESAAVCHDMQAQDDFFKGREEFTGFRRVWPTDSSDDTAEPLADYVAAGERMESKWGYWAFLIGITGAVLLYCRGYALTRWLNRVPPARWIKHWLKNGMYFDELYFAVIVGTALGISRLCAWLDRGLIDGAINRFAAAVRAAARLAGRTDQYVVDGAVNGLGALAQDLGAAVRVPQTGRVRVYVTILMFAVMLALAAAVIVALSHSPG
jgi:proton-translocating NADH-quinone oxidoreductase chain L